VGILGGGGVACFALGTRKLSPRFFRFKRSPPLPPDTVLGIVAREYIHANGVLMNIETLNSVAAI